MKPNGQMNLTCWADLCVQLRLCKHRNDLIRLGDPLSGINKTFELRSFCLLIRFFFLVVFSSCCLRSILSRKTSSRKLQVFVVFARKQIALVIFVLFWRRDKQRMVKAGWWLVKRFCFICLLNCGSLKATWWWLHCAKSTKYKQINSPSFCLALSLCLWPWFCILSLALTV